MNTLSKRDRKLIWHPYTQMKTAQPAIGIIRGQGAWLFSEDGSKYLDAISSWWVNLHGHSHPYIARQIANQASKLEHCIFAGFTHEPAVTLAEKLYQLLKKKSLTKIFYSDNGSTAVEVALKMVMQYWKNLSKKKETIVAVEGAYHGDTFGSMSVSSKSMFTAPFSDYLFSTKKIPFPSEHALDRSLTRLSEILSENQVAAFIIEPLIQGAGGMRIFSKKALQNLFNLCREHGVLIIADEVMTGFGRTGSHFATDYIDTQPDIICLSKGITGGTMPLGVTFCTDAIYDAFLSDHLSKTFFHGHSFTANPLACAAAIASIDILLETQTQKNIARISERMNAFSKKWENHPKLESIRQLGTIVALEFKTEARTDYGNQARDALYAHFLSKGILMRPLGNVVYAMPPYCTTNQELDMIYEAIEECIDKFPFSG